MTFIVTFGCVYIIILCSLLYWFDACSSGHVAQAQAVREIFVAKDDLELILLLLRPKCWDYRFMLPHPAYILFLFAPPLPHHLANAFIPPPPRALLLLSCHTNPNPFSSCPLPLLISPLPVPFLLQSCTSRECT